MGKFLKVWVAILIIASMATAQFRFYYPDEILPENDYLIPSAIRGLQVEGAWKISSHSVFGGWVSTIDWSAGDNGYHSLHPIDTIRAENDLVIIYAYPFWEGLSPTVWHGVSKECDILMNDNSAWRECVNGLSRLSNIMKIKPKPGTEILTIGEMKYYVNKSLGKISVNSTQWFEVIDIEEKFPFYKSGYTMSDRGRPGFVLEVLSGYTITATAGTGGTISPSGDVIVGEGKNRVFTITPDKHHIIKDVLVNGKSVGAVNSYTFQNVSEDATIEASFEEVGFVELISDEFSWGTYGWGDGQAVVNTNNPLNAVISVNRNGGAGIFLYEASIFDWTNATAVRINYSSSRNFTLALNDGEFGWLLETSIPAGVFRTADITLLGANIRRWCDVSNTSIRSTIDETFLSKNTAFDIIDESYGWVQVQNNINITSIEVSGLERFQNLHTITSSAGAGGTISPSGAFPVADGRNIKFTITPERHHKIKDVLVNDVSVGAVSSYTFQNVKSNATIEASFEQLEYIELISDEFNWRANPWGANATATKLSNNPLAGMINIKTPFDNISGANFSLDVRDLDLTNVSKIDMTYTSDKQIVLILWDEENRRDFYRILPSGNNVSTSFNLSSFHYWCRDTRMEIPASQVWDLSKITDIAIGKMWDEMSIALQITSLSITGLRPRAPENVAVVWGAADFVFNGREQRPSATAITANGVSLPLNIFGGAINAGTYTATAALAANTNFNLTGATKQFTIRKAPINPVLNISNAIVGNPLNPSVVGNLGGGVPVFMYATSANGDYSATPPTAQGNYFAKAVIPETANHLGAETAPVPFTITSASATTIAVVWGAQSEFLYDGTEKFPTATAMIYGTIPVPLTISGGAINAGQHTAIARLATSNNEIVLTNASRPFTITPKTLSENAISPISHFPFTGWRITPEIEVRDGDKILLQNIDYTIDYGTNISGTGSVEITGIGNYTGTARRTFAIASSGTPIANVVWTNTELVFDGSVQYPTATAKINDVEIPLEIIGKQTNAGSHTAVAQLKNPEDGIILVNFVRPYTISPKPVQITWSQPRTFVYNRSVQHPQASFDGDDVLDWRIVGAQSEAGEYTSANKLAPFVELLPANIRGNYELRNYSVDYKIEPRPLLVELNTPSTRISLDPKDFPTTESIISHLNGLIRFSGFQSNDEGSDDESVLTGAPSISLSEIIEAAPQMSRSAEANRLYSVNINTSAMSARNYTPQGRTDFVVELKSGATSIINTSASTGSATGIRFAQNPVSETAEISVVLPNASTGSATAVSIVIYDMTGNVVWASTASTGSATTATGLSWDLRNSAGRFVANGTYLVIAEVRGVSGKIYVYSARLGVKR